MQATPICISLRRAKQDDCRMLWQWANDIEVRRQSFSTEAIEWEEHVSWFRRKMNDADCLIYVAVDSQDRPVGAVRFAIAEGKATISASLDPMFRGMGLGRDLIAQGCRLFFQERPVSEIHALVKPENDVSLRAFESAGFVSKGSASVRGIAAELLVFRAGTRR